MKKSITNRIATALELSQTAIKEEYLLDADFGSTYPTQFVLLPDWIKISPSGRFITVTLSSYPNTKEYEVKTRYTVSDSFDISDFRYEINHVLRAIKRAEKYS